MNKKLIVLIIMLLSPLWLNAQEANTKAPQPFWSDQQTKQAELEKKYLQAISAEPENKKNYAYLAGLYLTNNKTAKAIDAYQDAITHDADNPKLFAGISIAYLHQSKYDMAKAMADYALVLDPELKQVKKINEYITVKQEALKAAQSAPLSKNGKQMGHSAVNLNLSAGKPNDAIHGKTE